MALALIVTPAVSSAQEPSLRDLLVRATGYVDTLLEQLSDTVAEERYAQRWRLPNARNNELLKRLLVSDYLIVRLDHTNRHYGLRDVFEVDGQPVRDREERLSRLFLNPSLGSNARIQGILSDSARYNLGDVQRNINTPTLALLFLSANFKSRFKFERAMDRSPSLKLDGLNTSDDVWVLAYEESWPTTVIDGTGGRPLPSKGRFWIEPDTGRVLASELGVRDSGWDLVIDVRYDEDEKMGHFVPVEMRERFRQPQVASRIVGTATYTRFRKFRVHVDESAPPRD